MSKTKNELIKELKEAYTKYEDIKSANNGLAEEARTYKRYFLESDEENKKLKSACEELESYRSTVNEAMRMKDDVIHQHLSTIENLKSDMCFERERVERTNARLMLIQQLITDETQNRSF
jgi:predicted  nucleic acid-binding Zn-ribbon protein